MRTLVINLFHAIDLFLYHLKTSQTSEAATGGVLREKVFFEISQNIQENTCVSLFFNKVAGLSLQLC